MSERVTKAIHYAILTIIAIIFVLPLVWLILAAFDLNASQALKWPSQWTLSNFTSVLTNTGNLRGFGVGLTISLIQSLIVVLVSGLAAYPLSRYRLTFKKQFMYVILFMTALPMIAVIVPVYKMFLNIGLLDSIPGVILYLTASALPFTVCGALHPVRAIAPINRTDSKVVAFFFIIITKSSCKSVYFF